MVGVKLMVEILDHAPDGWTSSERLLALAIAEHANDATRIGWPGMDLLTHRMNLDEKSVSRLLRQLAAKGFELRVGQGTDKKGRIVFATRSRRSVYRLPWLCPEEAHNTAACLERVAIPPPFEGEQGEEWVAVSPPIPEQRVAVSPPFSEERVASSSQWVAISPPLPLSTPQEPSPQTDSKIANAAHTGRRDWKAFDAEEQRAKASLEKLAEPLRTIAASLAETDPDATREEALAVLQLIVKQAHEAGKTIKSVRYYSTIANSGGFSMQLATVRAQRLTAGEKAKQDAHLAAKTELARLRETEPDCEHGTAAGRSPHPTTGALLCPQCRLGQPAPAQRQPTTPNPAQDVIDAYRASWAAAGHEPIEMTTLMAIGSEVAELLAARRSTRLLVELARIAGANRNTLTNTERQLAEAVR
jgi:DNA-binding MarR family transcriptional regulator